MGLEAGTWIDDLVVTNPPSTDDKRQGDDHLRLIKQVLKNSLKRTSGRPVYFPTSVSVTANYTILDSDENTIFRCDTTAGPFTLTLPNTLTTTNAGWKIIVVKVNTQANPVFVLPPAPALLDGFSKVRRTREHKGTEIMWTGVGWVATRPDSAPVGTVHEYYGTTLPNGYLWADGTTFVAADFVELNAVLGGTVKPDLRGRGSFGRDDMGGVAANRLTAAWLGTAGTVVGNAGGVQAVTIAQGNLPAVNLPSTSLGWSQGATTNATYSFAGTNVTITSDLSDWLRNTGSNTVQGGAGASDVKTGGNLGAVQFNYTPSGSVGLFSGVSMTGSISGVVPLGGSGVAMSNLPPAIVCNKIIVAE
jgi:hypothetical protein